MKVIGDLKINGQVQITGGKPGQDKILTSDPDGLATWETVDAVGLIGLEGEKGEPGEDGADGQDGVDGVQGIPGEKGDPGPADDKYINDLTFNGNQLTIIRNDSWSKTVDLSGLDDSALMGGDDGDWTVVGNNMYSNPSGDVGIGTLTPNSKLHIKDYVNSGGDGDYTILNLEHEFSDLGQQKVLIDFTLRDNNDNATPQVRIGAEVGWNGDANSMEKEGSGGFVIYTAKGDTPTTSTLTEKMRVDYIGNVGIGTSTPDSRLHVEGQVKIQDGTQGDGKVLTSDVNGLAAWKTAPTGSGDGESSLPIGSIIQYAGATAPAGWLLCDGKSYNEFSHTKLFNVIGLTYGAGEGTWVPGGDTDGGADFRVPLLNGRVPVGRNIGDDDFGNLGQIGGEREVTLKDSEIPHKSHNHTIKESGSGHWHPISWVHSGTGNQTGNSNGERASNVLNGHHLKHVDIETEWTRTGDHTFGAATQPPNGAHAGTNVSNTPKQDITQGEHSHSMSNGSATSNSGGGPHNNLQPYIVLNYIIYAGV